MGTLLQLPTPTTWKHIMPKNKPSSTPLSKKVPKLHLTITHFFFGDFYLLVLSQQKRYMWSKQYLTYQNCPKCIWKFSFYFPMLSHPQSYILNKENLKIHWISLVPWTTTIGPQWTVLYQKCFKNILLAKVICIIERQEFSIIAPTFPLQPSQFLSLSMI